MIDRLRVELFRGRIVWRAHGCAAVGQSQLFRDSRIGGDYHLRQTKIPDFHEPGFAKQDIGGFEVAMNQSFIVGVLHPRANLTKNAESPLDWQSFIAHFFSEMPSRHILHDVKTVSGVSLTKIEHRDDVGVGQLRHEPSFAVKTGLKLGIDSELLGQQFDGDFAL